MLRKFRDYFRTPTNGLLILTLFSFCIYLSLETITRMFNLFFYFPPIDIFLHFFSGMAFYFLFFWFMGFYTKKIKFRHLWSFALTFTFAIFWEIGEAIQELFVYNPPYLQDFFFWDGFFDIFWTLVASYVSFLIISKLRKKGKFLSREI